jgi:hypothetical protein
VLLAKISINVLHVEEIKGKILQMGHVIVLIGILMMVNKIQTAWNATTNVLHAKILLIV